MEILIGLAVFFVIWGVIVWRLKVVQHRTERYIDAAYIKPNHEKFSGYWYWPKSEN
jgi:hypothetical protein